MQTFRGHETWRGRRPPARRTVDRRSGRWRSTKTVPKVGRLLRGAGEGSRPSRSAGDVALGVLLEGLLAGQAAEVGRPSTRLRAVAMSTAIPQIGSRASITGAAGAISPPLSPR